MWLSDCVSFGLGLFGQPASEKVANDRRDLRSLAFQREVASIEQVDFGVRDVAFECFGAGWQEERVVPTPDCKQWRTTGAEVFLELGIEPRCCSESLRTNRAGFRRCRGGRAAPNLGSRPLARAAPGSECLVCTAIEWLPVSGSCAAPPDSRPKDVPIRLDWIPAFAQSLQIGVAVLRDDCCDLLRVAQGQAEADWRAVLEDIDRETIESQHLSELINHIRQVIKSVSKA